MNGSYTRISRQAKRVKGCDVYVSNDRKGSGWNLKRSKWALPVEMAKLPLLERQAKYREHVIESGLVHDIPELAHQLLGCWCEREDVCHVHVLKELLQNYTSQVARDSIIDDIPMVCIRRAPIYRVAAAKRARGARALLVAPAEPVSTVPPPSTVPPSTVPFKFVPKKILPGSAYVVGMDIEQFALGSIPLSAVMRFPVVIRTPEPVKHEPLPFNGAAFSEVGTMKQPPTLTKDCIAKLKNGSYTADGWPGFVCRVCKVARNKKTERFSLTLTDEWDADAAENPKKHLKVELGSQLFEAIKLRFIGTDDVVHVIDYAITNLTPALPEVEGVVVRQPKPKYFYFVTNLKKIVTT